DDFSFDYGWTASATATSGFWEREIPVGTQSAGLTGNPYFDSGNDCGRFAFTTGNGDQTIGGDDIDDGSVELKSPVFNLAGYVNPQIDFEYWFFNGFGSGLPNDSLTVQLSNGSTSMQVLGLGLGTATF